MNTRVFVIMAAISASVVLAAIFSPIASAQVLQPQAPEAQKTLGPLGTVSEYYTEYRLGSGRSTLNATCQLPGEVPVSGGYVTSSPDNLRIYMNAPDLNSTSWQVVVQKADINRETVIGVNVICLAPSAQAMPQQQEQQQPPSGQTTDLTVTTDKQDYSSGDTIRISGTVGEREAGSAVLIQITDPNGHSVWTELVKVFTDKTYQLAITAGEPQYSFSDENMDVSGNYLVSASYRTPDGDYLDADTTFRFDG